MRIFPKGQATIALSLAIPFLTAGICLSVDSWLVWEQQTQLQGTVYSAVILGIAYLPTNPAEAERIALRYAGRCNGFSSCPKIIFERVSVDRRSLRLVVRRKARYFLGGLPGSGHDVVVAKATAAIRPAGRVVRPLPVCDTRRIVAVRHSWNNRSFFPRVAECGWIEVLGAILRDSDCESNLGVDVSLVVAKYLLASRETMPLGKSAASV